MTDIGLGAFDLCESLSNIYEGYETANWILMDFGDVIIHIFDKENRLLYDLERIWRDGKLVDKDSL